MQTMISTATPHQTKARRCVTVRAMKSLMRMNKRPLNTNPREDANAVAGIVDPGRDQSRRWRGELREPAGEGVAGAPPSLKISRLKNGTERSRCRWRIAASFDSAREGIDLATRASHAAVTARLL